jgi:voltage-gated potassium channel
MQPRKRFQLAVSAIIALTAFGSAGLRLILDLTWFDSFYYTLITITTIGFSEPPGVTQEARYFIALLIILGVSTIGYALSAAAQAVVQFELISTFGKRKMFKDINKLSGHFIVCGAGRIGSGVIREIARRGNDFVIIENEEIIADRLLAQGYLVLMGDATNDEVLRAAGIERARGLVCAVSSDPDNLYITLTARDICKQVFIVARANDESAVQRLLRAGANKVVSPTITGSHQMAQLLLRPAVADLLALATMTEELALEIDQIEIHASSPFLNRPLKETGIRSDHGVMVIAIKRATGEMIFNPSADTVIEEMDCLIAIGSQRSLEGLEQMAKAPDRTPLRNP